MKPCTIVVKNKGRKRIVTAMRGEEEVTMLETTVTDDETGRVLNTVISHSAYRDTLTFSVFYNDESLADKSHNGGQK